MIHGDALITQTTGPAAVKDLLTEVQTSLDQLSAFSSAVNSVVTVKPKTSQVSVDTVPAMLTQPRQAAQSDAAAALLTAPSRQRRQAAKTPAPLAPDVRHADSTVSSSASICEQATPASELTMFQSPQLPGMDQPAAVPASDVAGMSDQWANMQPELLGNVLQQVNWSGREAIALTAVCRSAQ